VTHVHATARLRSAPGTTATMLGREAGCGWVGGCRPSSSRWSRTSPWSAFVVVRFDGRIPFADSPPDQWAPPGVGLARTLGTLLDQPLRGAGWELAYVALVLGTVGGVAWAARRRITAESVIALAYGLAALCLGTGVWLDRWAFVRLSAPLLAFAILAGVSARGRTAVAFPCAAAALTALAPVLAM